MFTKGIHHVAIICSDYERSKHFYVNILGLPIIQETFRAARDSYKLDLDVGHGGSDRTVFFSQATRSTQSTRSLRTPTPRLQSR